MVDILYLLTKYFNYELTHTYYKTKTLKTSEIKKIKSDNLLYINELLKNFDNYDDLFNPKQCVDLINFPKNFT